MMCFSPSMDTSFSQAALSAPSIIVPMPFTGGETDLYTWVGEPYRPTFSAAPTHLLSSRALKSHTV